MTTTASENTPGAETTESRRSSAYPVPVIDLLPQARALATRLGSLPSRNRLMTELKVGAPKARALLEALEQGGGDPGETGTPSRLHLVPEQTSSGSVPVPAAPVGTAAPQVNRGANPGATPTAGRSRTAVSGRGRVRSWPVLLLAAPAFVAIWSGWVGLGGLTGFGVVHPLPGIWDELRINTAITLPIGVETYAAFALRAWLSGSVPARARRFAKWSAIGSLVLGAAGQVAYHLMTAAEITQAPWQITALVACLPVAVLGMGAALAHLLHQDHNEGQNHADVTGREVRA